MRWGIIQPQDEYFLRAEIGWAIKFETYSSNYNAGYFLAGSEQFEKEYLVTAV